MTTNHDRYTTIIFEATRLMEEDAITDYLSCKPESKGSRALWCIAQAIISAAKAANAIYQENSPQQIAHKLTISANEITNALRIITDPDTKNEED